MKPKFPKVLGDVIDRLYELREEKATAANVVKQCGEAETALRLHAMEKFGKAKLTGARGKLAQCSIVESVVPNVDDWDALYGWIAAPLLKVAKGANVKDALERVKERLVIFQRRLSTEAWTEFMNAKQPVLGTKPFNMTKLSLTKVGGKKGKKSGT